MCGWVVCEGDIQYSHIQVWVCVGGVCGGGVWCVRGTYSTHTNSWCSSSAVVYSSVVGARPTTPLHPRCRANHFPKIFSVLGRSPRGLTT